MKNDIILLHIDKKTCNNCEMFGCCKKSENVCSDWGISFSEYIDAINKLPKEQRNTIAYDMDSEFKVVEEGIYKEL